MPGVLVVGVCLRAPDYTSVGLAHRRVSLCVCFSSPTPVDDCHPHTNNNRYITIANMPDQQSLPAYAIRASCININTPLQKQPRGSINSTAAANSTTAASISSSKEVGLPCPVPSPGGKQCNGHGTCRSDTSVSWDGLVGCLGGCVAVVGWVGGGLLAVPRWLCVCVHGRLVCWRAAGSCLPHFLFLPHLHSYLSTSTLLSLALSLSLSLSL